MIKLNATDIIKENKEPKASQVKQETPQEQLEATSRPEVVDAKVYKLKSAFVKNSVFITLSYVKNDNGIRPIEIFINSKDLTKTSRKFSVPLLEFLDKSEITYRIGNARKIRT